MNVCVISVCGVQVLRRRWNSKHKCDDEGKVKVAMRCLERAAQPLTMTLVPAPNSFLCSDPETTLANGVDA